jgi:hypothetical protein
MTYPGLRRWLPRILLIVEIALFFSICRDVAYVSTRRLYLTRRVEQVTPSTAAQRFVIEDARVVPQIVTRDQLSSGGPAFQERIAFRSTLDFPSTLQVQVRRTGTAHYEIHWRDRDANRTLASGDGVAISTVTAAVPQGRGVIEFVSHGPVTWVDPRLVGDLRVAGRTATLFVLLIGSLYVRRRQPYPQTADQRLAWFRKLALATAAIITVAFLEVGLRALGDRVPPALAAQRHDLGEVRRDARWEETRRYGRRLRADVDATNEWRYGDIVRMGFIPADVSDGVLHRFQFHTDHEGFRNARTRQRIDVAALGDSFTDAMTIDAADAWTSRLESATGLAVQNYGTAGFGPQQELRVLTDYALLHHPRLVVLAYFAGNDLFDAEAFDEFDRSGGVIRRPEQGWQIRDVVSRADTWFVGSVVRAAMTWTSTRQRAEAQTMAASTTSAGVRREQTAPFDRGMFMLPIAGHAVRWAFMPAYLNTLNFTEQDLGARRGWTLTRQAIGDMRDASRRAGAELVVLFLPFKEQLHLPLLDVAMARDELTQALRFSLDDLGGKADVTAMLRNRLAQNNLMRTFCAAAGIPFLDMTPVLDARVRQGENVYFPDESHLNETGHALVAETLKQFIDQR